VKLRWKNILLGLSLFFCLLSIVAWGFGIAGKGFHYWSPSVGNFGVEICGWGGGLGIAAGKLFPLPPYGPGTFFVDLQTYEDKKAFVGPSFGSDLGRNVALLDAHLLVCRRAGDAVADTLRRASRQEIPRASKSSQARVAGEEGHQADVLKYAGGRALSPKAPTNADGSASRPYRIQANADSIFCWFLTGPMTAMFQRESRNRSAATAWTFSRVTAWTRRSISAGSGTVP
jgi:hypothetical protein